MDKADLNNLMSEVTYNRDEIAFSKLFDYLAPKINAYFIQNGLDVELSEELTQEVMSILWSKSNSYNPSKSALSTWIFTIARNKKVDFFRKNSRINMSEDDVRQFLYEDNEIDKAEQDIIKEKVAKINDDLDENQQKIIKMNFFENKSHKKIAEELEIPLGTVKSRIRHILIKMQKNLL
tara:strand:+ start:961 stop:1497 length:537 start_codon:yes stop_codon:yes gene_type:complete